MRTTFNSASARRLAITTATVLAVAVVLLSTPGCASFRSWLAEPVEGAPPGTTNGTVAVEVGAEIARSFNPFLGLAIGAAGRLAVRAIGRRAD